MDNSISISDLKPGHYVIVYAKNGSCSCNKLQVNWYDVNNCGIVRQLTKSNLNALSSKCSSPGEDYSQIKKSCL
jgi:hypothetical protein